MTNATSADECDALPSGGRAELARLIRSFGEKMRQRVHAVVEEHDLTPPLFAALHVLEEPHSMGEVAELLSCDASYVTGLADRLETLGLAERRPSPADRRIKQLVLTERGSQVRSQVLSKVEVSRAVFPELTDDEVNSLVALLRKILD